MTDRRLCVKCIYSYFTHRQNLKTFRWCNYLEWTGKPRPHDKNECYGFKERNDEDEYRSHGNFVSW